MHAKLFSFSFDVEILFSIWILNKQTIIKNMNIFPKEVSFYPNINL